MSMVSLIIKRILIVRLAVECPQKAECIHASTKVADRIQIRALAFGEGWARNNFQKDVDDFEYREVIFRGFFIKIRSAGSKWVLWLHFDEFPDAEKDDRAFETTPSLQPESVISTNEEDGPLEGSHSGTAIIAPVASNDAPSEESHGSIGNYSYAHELILTALYSHVALIIHNLK